MYKQSFGLYGGYRRNLWFFTGPLMDTGYTRAWRAEHGCDQTAESIDCDTVELNLDRPKRKDRWSKSDNGEWKSNEFGGTVACCLL